MELFFVCLAAVVLAGIYYFNRLVKQKQHVHEAWSGIDVQLKRRAELLPSLVEVVKAYAKHEKTVFEDVTALRSRAQQEDTENVTAREGVEGKLAQSIGQLFAVVENYPDLKADENFMALQDSLIEIENTLQMARRYYNGSVRDMNILVQSFPGNMIAGLCKFKTAVFFKIENPLEKLSPELDLKEDI